ncbi:uncharacterized protein LOC123535489 [Mercenaria mercenaria]|uniref:uncharacterized protein LOC123535489 n=1 Tax=Mercenaria mercenaria TaxID=6596 RepID=UPI00234E7B2F|nr:uncharacterized protein LOC123535489 [Mercenaria mercenaria]
MDQGVCYIYGAAAFPRYRFFQQHLKRLVDRWQTILDAGGLPDCISQGRIKLKEILSLANQVDANVAVNVFADSEFLETGISEDPLQCNQTITGIYKILTWDDFTQSARNANEPTVTVVVLRSREENEVKGVKERISKLPKEELGNFIIYFADTKTSVLFAEISNADFQQQDADQTKSKAEALSIPLNQQIQYLFEEKAISVLDRIAQYNKVFIPKKQDDSIESFEDAVYIKLLTSLRNSFVVKDLSPEGNDKVDEAARKPTDQELSKIAAAMGSNWDMVGPSLGITQANIDEIKQLHEGQTAQIYSMLSAWRQKDGSTLKYLLQLMENVSSVITVDMTVIKEIEEAAPAPKTDSEKDEIFHKKLLDFVAKKTKCVACDKLSLKYGISANLINEFLNDGFYGYEKKVEEIMAAMSLPCWPRDKSDNGVSTCRLFSYRCAVNMNKMTRETEDYIKVKHRVLVALKRLQFQLLGLLEETNIPLDTKIPEIPKLPLELQHAILEMPDVYGCGTVWGELLIHVTKAIPPIKRDEARNLLSKYMYMYGYTTEVIESESEDAGGFTAIEHGSGIRAKRLNAENADEDHKYKYGSLGCFVRVKPKSEEATNAVTTNFRLHGLTCAHCVRECDARVEIKHGEQYVELGQKQHDIYEPHSFDVATVEIDQTKANKCDTSLKNGNRAWIKKWNFHEKPPVRTPVYKYGSATGLTLGTCISNNYQTKEMMKNWNEKLKNKNEPFDPDYNILISREDIQENLQISGIAVEPEARPTEDQEVMECDNRVTLFSQSGDSGSVVCMDDPKNDERIQVLSLLMGSVKQGDGDTYTYSSHIHKTVQELQKRYNRIIEPACEVIGAGAD